MLLDKFNIIKLNNRPKSKNTVLFCCFSEFGCETLNLIYTLPSLIRMHSGKYLIGVGWHDRSPLYKHLLDEFWELKPEFMYLKDTVNCLSHVSKELDEIENKLKEFGKVFKTSDTSVNLLCDFCYTCGGFTTNRGILKECGVCKSTNIKTSTLYDLENKKNAFLPRIPYKESVDKVKDLNNIVGIFARNRQQYGRNLSFDFYIKLIEVIKQLGYTPVWLGEQVSTYSCPEGVLDLSQRNNGNIDLTFAIVQKCVFTVQAFTASSRIAGLVKTPYLLIESPDQIFYDENSGFMGQEGLRLNLLTFGNKKLLLYDFEKAKENEDELLKHTVSAIDRLVSGNYEDQIGVVNDFSKVINARKNFIQNYLNIG